MKRAADFQKIQLSKSSNQISISISQIKNSQNLSNGNFIDQKNGEFSKGDEKLKIIGNT